MTRVVIKTDLKAKPEDCDSCQWHQLRPHPFKGWTDICELMGHTMDDDDADEWYYDGKSTPKMCPLAEMDKL